MILVSYDGSADAQAAIDHVAELMPGAKATVLTVWEPIMDALMRSGSLGAGMGMGVGLPGAYAESESIDAAVRGAALARATEGAERAVAAGLIADARCEGRDGDVANTILAAAAEVEADLVVMGTRGLSGVKAFLLGSVSQAVVHHSDRAVMVVPSAALAERRHGRVHHTVASA